MDPLTLALITAISTAAGTILGGAAEAAGSDAWAAAKRKLAGWTRLDERRKGAAFDQALRDAVTALRQNASRPAQVDRALSLLTDDSPDGRAFRAVAINEFLFSGEPDFGRVLDEYRRNLRFVALLRREQAPPWGEVESTLQLLFQHVLPAELLRHDELKQIVLNRAELQALAAARTTAHSSADSAATLRRIEALLTDMTELPRIKATIHADQGASVSNAPITVVLGNQHSYAVTLTPPPNLDALYRQYCTFLVNKYRILDFRGIVQVQNVVRLQLEEIYVPLRGAIRAPGTAPVMTAGKLIRPHEAKGAQKQPASVHIRTEYGKLLLTEHSEGLLMESTQHPRTLHDLVRDHPYLVVLGDPGTGKSTLVKVIMLALAEGRAGSVFDLDDEWLPIFFPVAAFAEVRRDPGSRDIAPLAYLRDFYGGSQQPDYTPLFERALLAGRAIMLFDGLDEVREERLAITRCLEDFIRAWDAPGNRFLATSRIAGYEDAPLDDGLFTRATVQTFNDDDISSFAANWSRAFEQAGAPDLAPHDPALLHRIEQRNRDLSGAIFDDPNVTDLARNPLLLTILALIHNQGTRMPDRRVDLYRLCVEALAETWNRARNLAGREFDIFLGDEKLDERFVVNLLGPAALWIHAENPGGIVDERDLEQQLAAILVETDGLPKGKAARLAADFLRLVNRETGLLQERGDRRYSFLHLTFEEYLAARGLLESATVADADAEIHRRATDPGWREVIRLALASANQREASRLLLHVLAAPSDPKSHGRPVILAGECLLDLGRNGATQRAWSAVIVALIRLIGDPAAAIATRVEAGHLLGRLGDPRLLDPRTGEAAGHGDYEQVESYWCQIAAGSFWFGDERV
ncbi:MAG: NACHT domain-containing protein, partial [Oscillochloridaceae bacterium umkhey_bin13]